MDRHRLKNIIIIILLLLNGFLLSALLIREAAVRSAHSRTVDQLTALFAEDDMILYENAFSSATPPAELSFTRDLVREQAVAAFFLGDALVQDDESDGLRAVYTRGAGSSAQFRSGGSFAITGIPARGDAETLCREFCRTFSYEAPVFTLDAQGSGMAVAVAVHNGLSVYNCTVSFSITEGALTSVIGTLLPAAGTAVPFQKEPLSAPAALITFQQYRRESGASASAVTAIALCYELQSSAVSLSLSPAWCIETDIAKYYVDCVSGTVSTG
ncbi:MAG: hypothetical protein E7429_03730 [Ruminococcaceae bacterium]|nr:hypothetical protein [Oscillospiraceae bacterium]